MPLAPKLGTLDGAEKVYESLRDMVPVIRGPALPPMEATTAQPVNVLFGAAGGQTKMINRARTLSVTVASTAVIVETSTYTRYEEFAQIVEEVLRATVGASPLAGIQRVGLRYVDEIRVPGITVAEDWGPYINASLLAGTALTDTLKPVRTEGRAEFVISENQRAHMRFGALTKWIVDPNGVLRLRRSDDGPFFLIDLDSFWTASEDDIPEFSVGQVLATCEMLREPVRALFEAAITERLRDEILRKGGAEE